MPWFSTAYNPENPFISTKHFFNSDHLEGDEYAGQVWARDINDAILACLNRGIGERVTSGALEKPPSKYSLPSAIARRGNLSMRERMELVHGACFISYLAVSAGVMEASDTLSDSGLLHQVIHELEEDRPNLRDLAFWLESVEAAIPGLAPY